MIRAILSFTLLSLEFWISGLSLIVNSKIEIYDYKWKSRRIPVNKVKLLERCYRNGK